MHLDWQPGMEQRAERADASVCGEGHRVVTHNDPPPFRAAISSKSLKHAGARSRGRWAITSAHANTRQCSWLCRAQLVQRHIGYTRGLWSAIAICSNLLTPTHQAVSRDQACQGGAQQDDLHNQVVPTTRRAGGVIPRLAGGGGGHLRHSAISTHYGPPLPGVFRAAAKLFEQISLDAAGSLVTLDAAVRGWEEQVRDTLAKAYAERDHWWGRDEEEEAEILPPGWAPSATESRKFFAAQRKKAGRYGYGRCW